MALDTDFPSYHTLSLLDPAGAVVDEMAFPVGSDIPFSNEVFASNPAAGQWMVRLEYSFADADDVRMRAKLEQPIENEQLRPLYPNLRPLAPIRLSFSLVTTPASCHPDEVAEDGVTRCLRFDFGYGNIGDGPYEVLFAPIESGLAEGDVAQRVTWSDGSSKLIEAGTYEYHATHGHYHYNGILQLDLFRVVDEAGTLEFIVEGAKRGACAHDWRIAHFDAFIAARHGTHDSGNECSALPGNNSPTGARIGLSRGWTDIYDAALPDNYVDAGEMRDGLHVLRVTIDAAQTVTETNEMDNVGYTYFNVEANQIEILERGLGLGPWDPEKLVTTRWVP